MFLVLKVLKFFQEKTLIVFSGALAWKKKGPCAVYQHQM